LSAFLVAGLGVDLQRVPAREHMYARVSDGKQIRRELAAVPA